VNGVSVEIEGRTIRMHARRGVIFGAGGFSHNRDLLDAEFGGKTAAPVGTCAAKTNSGDFIRIARRHGIPTSNLDSAWFKQCILPFNPQRMGQVFFLNMDSFIVVDRSGKRYANEKNFYQQRGLQMYRNPERRCVFCIFDERARKLYEGPLKGLGGPVPFEAMQNDCLCRGRNEQELADAVRSKLAEVAPGFELEHDFARTLSTSLERFNKFAVEGKDLEFGRGESVPESCWHVKRAADNKHPNKTMMPIDRRGLCCLVMGLSTLDTKGGPRINRSAQVLGADGQAVPGLFGAGNCVRSFTNISYPASGTTISSGILFGYIAGREAMVGSPASKL